MSSLGRLSLLSSRLACKRYQIAVRARAALVSHSSLRFTSNAARRINRPNEFVDNVTGMNSPSITKRFLRDLNDQAQRGGRVNLSSIKEAISHAEKIGFLRGVETQFLLRATGSFLKDALPSERDKLGEQIWNLAKKDELDISHYNTLLYIKLENGTPFDPSEFLQELSNAGVAPNRVTYQRLVHRYCQLGDVQNATKIIEFMKSQDLPISEKIFHSLIVGHLRAGDPQKARGIIGIMDNANLTPTADTYAVLAEALAEQGDTSAAIEAVSNQTLMDYHILSIAKQVAMRDDLGALENVLTLTPEHGYRDYNVVNTCLELIVAKKLDAALFIWQNLKSFLPRQNSGNFIPVQMMKRGYPIEQVYKVCQEFKDDGMGSTLFVEVARNALNSGDRDLAQQYLEQLRVIGHPIRPHYFLPIICLASSDSEVFSALKLMIDHGHQPLLESLVDIILPRLDSSDPNSVLQSLKQVGVNDSLAVGALAIHLLLQKRVEHCEQLLVNERSAVNYRRLASLLGSATNADNLTSAISILSTLVDKVKAESLHIDVVGLFLEHSHENTNSVIEQLSASRLPISGGSFSRLQAAGFNVDPLSGNVTELRSKPRPYRLYSELSKDELETQIAQLAEGESLNSALRRLLIHYCKDRDVAKVDETLGKLSDTELNGANLACLTELYTNLGEIDRALEFYRKLNECADFHVDSYKVLFLAEALVEQHRLPEAIAILDEQADQIKRSLENFNVERNVGRLLTAVYKRYGKEQLFEVYEKNLSPLADSRAFGSLVKELSETDASAAFDMFKELMYKYRSSPYKKLVGKCLIRENKQQELDSFISMLDSTIGTFDCAMELAICYLECDKVDKAKEMLLRCGGGRRAKANLIKACNAYVNDNKFEKLEALLRLLEELGVEKDVVAFYRIKLYNQANDVEKALEVWTHAQEENVTLFPVALEILAKLLEKNGQPVPFVVPESGSPYGNARFAASKFHDVLEGSLDKALEHRAELKAQNQQLTVRETCSLIHELINQDRLQEAFTVVKDFKNFNSLDLRQKTVVNRLMGVAADKGLIETLEELYEYSGKVIGLSALQRAHINKGQVVKFLEKLEAMPLENVRCYISSDILKRDPSVGARFEKLCERLANELQMFSGVAQCWYLYVAHSDVDKARQLLVRFPALESFLEKFRIQSSVKESFDRHFFDRLLQITSNQSITSKALACTLHELTRLGKIDEANECLNVAKQNNVDTSRCSLTVLQKMGHSIGSDVTSNLAENQSTEKAQAQSN